LVYALGGNESSANIFKLKTDDGSILWRSNLTSFVGIPSVLATYQGQVVIESGNQILSLNYTSGGASLWNIDIGASIYYSTVYQGVLLFGASDGNLYEFDLQSGILSCQTQVDSQRLLNQTNADLTIYPIKVDPEKQRVYWSFGVTQKDQFKATIVSLDLATCKVEWTKQIQDSTLSLESQAGIAVNKNSVFFTENNALWVFDASSGNLAKNQRFEHYILAPELLGNVVLVASDLGLTAYA
jgi:outer membrane protein assembly factor BamB